MDENNNVVVRVGDQEFIRGEDGFDPVVTVEDIEHGHRVTITDREHPIEGQSFDVMDGASAYEQAVAGGYEGTEEEFNADLADFSEKEQTATSAAATAVQSAQNAAGSASTATTKAQEAADSAATALTRMNSANSSAQAAAGSATSADNSANAAATSASAANGSAASASASESNAANSATNAAASETAAAASELAAAASATAASNSAAAAAQSASAIGEYEHDAEAWAIGKRGGTDVGTTDETYHNNSKYYAAQAAADASTASSAASAASQSEQNAASSASAADQSATDAAASKNAAVESATTAASHATNAASSATAASGSATAAAGSATAAGNAQAAAETAQGLAEDAQEAAEQAQSDAETAAQSVSQSAAQIGQNAADIGDLKSAINTLRPAATDSDVGKALIVKTVQDGKPTSYEYGEAGGGGDTTNCAPVIIDTASGNVAHFTDGADNRPVRKISAIIEGNGRTEATISIANANLFDGDVINARYDDGVLTPTGSYRLTKNSMPAEFGESVFFRDSSGNISGPYVTTFDKDGNFLKTERAATGYYTFTDQRARTFKACIPKSLYDAGGLYYIGYEATNTPPASSGTSVSINWESQAGTISNGSLTLYENGNAEITDSDSGITYALTGVGTLNTFLGENNIWADCGGVTVEYDADTKLYIQKVNAPADDDMTADAQIASGKYFIVGNTLYLSTATIPAGDAIIPGSNCQKTNLAAALNALNT